MKPPQTTTEATRTKHTPGPWRACEPGSNFQKGKVFIRPMNGEQLIATIASEPRFIERRANARLIAAAPDLLEALQDLLVSAGEAANYLHNLGIGFDFYMDDEKAAKCKAIVSALHVLGAHGRAAIAKAEEK